MMKKSAIKPLLCLALFAAVPTLHATPVNVAFTGNTYQIFNYGQFMQDYANSSSPFDIDTYAYLMPAISGTSITEGGVFHGSLTYDSGATFKKSVVDPYGYVVEYYYQSPFQIELTFEGASGPNQISYSGNAELRLTHALVSGLSDQLDFTVDPTAALSHPNDLPGWDIALFDVVSVSDPNGFDFSANPPTIPQNINEDGMPPNGSSLTLQYNHGSDAYIVYTYFTSVQTVSSVPIPQAALLFGTALTGLAGLTRRKNK